MAVSLTSPRPLKRSRDHDLSSLALPRKRTLRSTTIKQSSLPPLSSLRPLSSLPEEILSSILHWLHVEAITSSISLCTLADVARTCKTLRRVAEPLLYHTINLDLVKGTHRRQLVRTLSQCPSAAQSVRRWIVHQDIELRCARPTSNGQASISCGRRSPQTDETPAKASLRSMYFAEAFDETAILFPLTPHLRRMDFTFDGPVVGYFEYTGLGQLVFRCIAGRTSMLSPVRAPFSNLIELSLGQTDPGGPFSIDDLPSLFWLESLERLELSGLTEWKNPTREWDSMKGMSNIKYLALRCCSISCETLDLVTPVCKSLKELIVTTAPLTVEYCQPSYFGDIGAVLTDQSVRSLEKLVLDTQKATSHAMSVHADEFWEPIETLAMMQKLRHLEVQQVALLGANPDKAVTAEDRASLRPLEDKLPCSLETLFIRVADETILAELQAMLDNDRSRFNSLRTITVEPMEELFTFEPSSSNFAKHFDLLRKSLRTRHNIALCVNLDRVLIMETPEELLE